MLYSIEKGVYMKLARIAVFMLFFITLVCVSNAHCSVIWNWSFEKDAVNVGQGDTITLNATLTNSSLSDQNFTKAMIDGYLFGSSLSLDPSDPSFVTYYTFSYGPGPADNFLDQFDTLSLAPGDEFSFVFGRIIPTTGTAPIGSHFYITGGIGTMNATHDVIDMKGDSLDIFVTGGSAVPEPASLSLLGLGLGGLLLRRRKI